MHSWNRTISSNIQDATDKHSTELPQHQVNNSDCTKDSTSQVLYFTATNKLVRAVVNDLNMCKSSYTQIFSEKRKVSKKLPQY